MKEPYRRAETIDSSSMRNQSIQDLTAILIGAVVMLGSNPTVEGEGIWRRNGVYCARKILFASDKERQIVIDAYARIREHKPRLAEGMYNIFLATRERRESEMPHYLNERGFPKPERFA